MTKKSQYEKPKIEIINYEDQVKTFSQQTSINIGEWWDDLWGSE